MKQNLVIFDFCETIANFQTADAFVEFVLTKKPKSWRNFYYEKIISYLKKNYIIAICHKFFPKKNIEKRLNRLREFFLWEIFVQYKSKQSFR
jgi:hypothetical protein